MCCSELGTGLFPPSFAPLRLLDPDFRAPYVNLGVAYLRLKLFEEAIHISEACLERHPSSPQCQCHGGNWP